MYRVVQKMLLAGLLLSSVQTSRANELKILGAVCFWPCGYLLLDAIVSDKQAKEIIIGKVSRPELPELNTSDKGLIMMGYHNVQKLWAYIRRPKKQSA